jgi:hypothetical protein
MFAIATETESRTGASILAAHFSDLVDIALAASDLPHTAFGLRRLDLSLELHAATLGLEFRLRRRLTRLAF